MHTGFYKFFYVKDLYTFKSNKSLFCSTLQQPSRINPTFFYCLYADISLIFPLVSILITSITFKVSSLLMTISMMQVATLSSIYNSFKLTEIVSTELNIFLFASRTFCFPSAWISQSWSVTSSEKISDNFS